MFKYSRENFQEFPKTYKELFYYIHNYQVNYNSSLNHWRDSVDNILFP
jgi:hypothetical protein